MLSGEGAGGGGEGHAGAAGGGEVVDEQVCLSDTLLVPGVVE